MRALITATINAPADVLDRLPQTLEHFLIEQGWWPALDQDHPEVVAMRDEILKTVSNGDHTLAKETYLFTIYHEESRSWGIISRPNRQVITIRVKNPVAERLKAAAEKIVDDCLNQSRQKRPSQDIHFLFRSRIEVFEPGSGDHAYFGEILPANRFLLAISQRRTEFYVGLIASTAAILMLICTLPPVIHALIGHMVPEWQLWLRGLLERLGSSAVVTATVSGLNVFLHWLDLRRKRGIRWLV